MEKDEMILGISMTILKSAFTAANERFKEKIRSTNYNRLQKTKEKRENKGKSVSLKLNTSELFDGSIELDYEITLARVKEHVENTSRWARTVKFSDLEKERSLGSVYIQLDTYLMPLRKHYSEVERSKKLRLEEAVLSKKGHCVILGQPGAGKTTSLKKIYNSVALESSTSQYSLPLLLRFRDVNVISSTTILDFILNIIPIKFDFFGKDSIDSGEEMNQAREHAVTSFLNHIGAILVLDGFDELRDANSKDLIIRELRGLCNKLDEAKIVVSCRTGEFNYELEHSKTYEIAPLSSNQIEEFVKLWLRDESKIKDFLQKVSNSPFSDTSIKPLSLVHLCAIYQRIGNIPEQPKLVYRKVVNLLIYEWDEQRSVIRESAFTDFQPDQKLEFLIHLSFWLTVKYNSSIFAVQQMQAAYLDISDRHNLPKDKSKEVIRELESHTGLFIESGYEKFEFAHKSIQEYLTAEYLVRLPSLNSIISRVEILGSELAIAVAISSDSSLFFIECVINYLNKRSFSSAFYNSFISRIVSENPTFNEAELVSVSALVLLSNWVNPNNKVNEFSNITINLDDFLSFYDLADCLKLKHQKTKIFKYYRYEKGIHNNDYVMLKRIKVPTNHRRLPPKIFIPIDFYLLFDN